METIDKSYVYLSSNICFNTPRGKMTTQTTLRERKTYIPKTTNVNDLIKQVKVSEKKEKIRVLVFGSLTAVTLSTLAIVIMFS